VVVSKWEGALDEAHVIAHLDRETVEEEADEPEKMHQLRSRCSAAILVRLNGCIRRGGPAESNARTLVVPFGVGRQVRRATSIETAARAPFLPVGSVNSVAK